MTLHDLLDCSLPGSSIHGIFQARVLEWVAIAFSSHATYSLNVLIWPMTSLPHYPPCPPHTLAKFSVVFQTHQAFSHWYSPVHDVQVSWITFPLFSSWKKKNTQFKRHNETFLKFSMERASFLPINNTWVHMFIIAIITTKRNNLYISLLSCVLLQERNSFLYYHYIAVYLVHFGCLTYYLKELLHKWSN